jgi:tetrahydromethanopterin S-methyltransferase subunit B
VSWGGFSSWSAVALDSVIHGFVFGIALTALAQLVSFGIAAVVHSVRSAIR